MEESISVFICILHFCLATVFCKLDEFLLGRNQFRLPKTGIFETEYLYRSLVLIGGRQSNKRNGVFKVP